MAKKTGHIDELNQLMDSIAELFRYGGGPIIWLQHPLQQQAPLYLVSHHGAGIKRHACFQQWGCLKCGEATSQLYHAHWEYEKCLQARVEVVEFLRPMLSLLPSFKKLAEGDPIRMSRLLGEPLPLAPTVTLSETMLQRHELLTLQATPPIQT